MTSPTFMNRRDAVKRMALLMGGTLVGAGVLLRGQSVPDKGTLPAFTDADRATLDEIGETILPKTDIPGAKDVGIGAFMAMMVTDCYDPREHAAFVAGLAKVGELSQARFGKSFVEASAEERLALLNDLDKEQAAHHPKKDSDEPPHYFRMMKELTNLGYFSSEIGCTKAVRYIEVPGRFDGDIPYKKGDPAWYN